MTRDDDKREATKEPKETNSIDPSSPIRDLDAARRHYLRARCLMVADWVSATRLRFWQERG
jgi:hypothetical protein